VLLLYELAIISMVSQTRDLYMQLAIGWKVNGNCILIQAAVK
jgi:hypothetical protein